jgi:hypothetical protein
VQHGHPPLRPTASAPVTDISTAQTGAAGPQPPRGAPSSSAQALHPCSASRPLLDGTLASLVDALYDRLDVRPPHYPQLTRACACFPARFQLRSKLWQPRRAVGCASRCALHLLPQLGAA